MDGTPMYILYILSSVLKFKTDYLRGTENTVSQIIVFINHKWFITHTSTHHLFLRLL